MSDPEDTLRKGLEFEGSIHAVGLSIREKSKSAYETQWLDARLQLTAMLAHLQEFKSCVPGKSNPSISERLALVAVFCQGLWHTESLVSEGQYVKAAAVLKQDYEIMVRINEVRGGNAIPGKIPNVRHAPKGSQRLYGDLNNLAHPSNLHLIQLVIGSLEEGEVHGVSAIPEFNEYAARSLYELHVWLMCEVVREAIILAVEMYGAEEPGLRLPISWFPKIIKMLEEVGFQLTDADSPQ